METEYYVQADFRTRVVALTKKVGRRETEVILNVITEQKSFSEWKPKKLVGKAQYEKFFDEIEMECYRVLSKGE